MQNELKQRIHTLVDSIPDETKLQLLMADVKNFISETEEGDHHLTNEELDQATAEFDRGEYVSEEDLETTRKESTEN